MQGVFCCFDINGLLNQAGIAVSGFKWRFLLLVFWPNPSARTRSSKSIPMTLVGHAHFLLVLPLELLLLPVDVLVLLAQTPQSFCCLRLAVFCVFIVESTMQDVTSGPETPMKMHCTLASSHCGGHFSSLKSKSEGKGGLVVVIDGTGLNEQSSQERHRGVQRSAV